MKLKKKYKKGQEITIQKQIKKIGNAIDKLLDIKSGGYENYEKYNKLVQPLIDFKYLVKEVEQ